MVFAGWPADATVRDHSTPRAQWPGPSAERHGTTEAERSL